MKAGIMKALGNAAGRGRAEEALTGLPEGGMPADLPPEAPEMMPPEIEMPEAADMAADPEAMGPTEFDGELELPEVSMGRPPEFDGATGLPLIAVENMAAAGDDEDDDEDEDDMMDLLV